MSAHPLRSAWLALAALALVSALPRAASADEPEPMVRFDPSAKPPPYTQSTLLLIGVAGAAVTYGGAVGASYLWADDPGASDLRIPVVGPWIKIGHTTMCVDETNGCNNVLQVIGAVAAGLDGLGQIGSLALLAEGLFAPTRAVRGPSAWSPRRAGFGSRLGGEIGDVRFTAVPFVQAGSDVGLGFVGTF
jgi:hypothetical protein